MKRYFVSLMMGILFQPVRCEVIGGEAISRPSATSAFGCPEPNRDAGTESPHPKRLHIIEWLSVFEKSPL